MLSTFDWLRRSRSSAELLTAMRFFAAKPGFNSGESLEPGPPFSALHGPCQRCFAYAKTQSLGEPEHYCKFCKMILARKKGFEKIASNVLIIWGLVPELARQFRGSDDALHHRALASFVPADDRFLLILKKGDLKDWLQELALYHGSDLRGMLQIFPGVTNRSMLPMGALLCCAARRESVLAAGSFYVQFFARPLQLLKPRHRDRAGMLTFEISAFLNLLSMAEVFRSLLFPHEQQQLYELLHLKDSKEEQFYWGRFLGGLSHEAKDMLAQWRIRQWPKAQVQSLYELIEYVPFSCTR